MPVTVPVGYETDGAQLDNDMTRDAQRAGAKAGKQGGKAFSGGFRSLIKPLAGLGAGLLVKDFIGDSLAEARESQKVGALTTQVIKSTGGAANVTAKEFGTLATAISNKTAIDDEQIQSAENLIATFTNIRNETGKNNDIFNQATKASVDLASSLAAASGGEVNFRASSIQVGKALNDPIKGVTALTKVGVTFTDQQKEQIKTLVKAGDTLGAQKIILRELSKEFGGAAQSQATDADKAKVAIKNLEEQIGTALLPTVDKLANKVSKDVVPAVSEFITGIEDGTGAGGEFADVVKNDVLPVAKNLGNEAVILFHALEPVFDLIKSLPPELIAFGGATTILGSKLGSLRNPLDANAKLTEKFGRGVANLAGGAGLIGLADAATQTNQVLGTLEGAASGAAIGLSVGGPLGAGIGAVGGALVGLLSSGEDGATGIRKAAEAARNTLPDFDNLTDSLLGNAAAFTKQTAAETLSNLQKRPKGGRSVVDVGKSVGITQNQLLDASLGKRSGQDAVQKGLLQFQNQINALTTERLRTQKEIDAIESKPRTQRTAEDNARLEDDQLHLDAVKAGIDFSKGSLKILKEGTGETLKQQKAELTKRAVLEDQSKLIKDLRKAGEGQAATLIDQKPLEASVASIESVLDTVHTLKNSTVKNLIDGSKLKPTKAELATILQYARDLSHARKLRIDATGTSLTALSGILRTANSLDGRNIKINVTTSTNANLAELAALSGRASGGPVSAGVPYLVGERRPEVFVPNQSGTIVPSVDQYASTVSRETSPPIVINQNYYGPTTSRGRATEITWALTYGTRARV